MNPPISLMLRYFDDDLTEQEVAELSRIVAESPAAARMLARLAIEEAHYGSVAGRLSRMGDAGDPPMKDVSASEDLRFALQHAGELSEADALLQHLLRMEQAAPLIIATQRKQESEATVEKHDRRLPPKESDALLPSLFIGFARTKQAKWLAAAAAVVLAVTLAVVLNKHNGGGNGPATTQSPANDTPAQSPRPVVATLTAEHHAVWERRPGKELFAGQFFTLTDGLVEMTTARGAVVILEAPASIELLDHPNAIRLHGGKLFGVCATPGSRGFTVHTEHARVADLGTRFGVRVDGNGGSRVRVFEGEVVVQPEALRGRPRATRTLAAGQGVSLSDPEMTVIDTSSQPMSFVSDRAFAMRQRDTGDPGGHWLAYRGEMTRRGDVVAFFDMTPEPGNPDRLVNRSVHGESFVSNGVIVKAAVTRGRHGWDSALSFDTEKAVKSYVQIEGKREMDAVTLTAWVRLDNHDKPHSAILNSDTHVGPGEVHWQIDQYGALQFTGAKHGRQGESIGVSKLSEKLSGLTDGGWHHLATTVDSQTGSVRFYFDGELVQSTDTAGIKHKVSLSFARIGHWVAPTDDAKNWDRQFQGEIDELIIFKRALSSEDIQDLYEYGRGPEQPPAG